MPDIQSTGPTLTGTAAALGTIMCEDFSIVILDITMSATTETVAVNVSVDGTNFSAATVRPLDLLTGALFASNNVKAGTFRLDVKGIKAIKLTKSATTETATVRTGLGQ
jgi:hypothetical protein